ncbi:hypothetical protein A6A06_01360 [Streptomyces sp. CB02923]|uniref:hypothetical protein n=1 Tax=Streptomyces sp. CB02923 TaxID=1718985 RepID=UPI00093C5BCD|nr:hypothetical protein [Streptomyces sp. CB02923]OKI09387.1 hypothetical protein A6A06_01360 [Streptomyces sp. CB02923]
MSDEVIGELRNTVNATRVVSVENDTVVLELSAAGTGQFLGQAVTDFGTHVSTRYLDGTESASAQIVITSESGQGQLVLVGSATGEVGAGGTVTFKGMVTARAPEGPFAELNGKALLGESVVDPDGIAVHHYRRY